MPRVYLSLGSNVEPERHLRLAIDELESRFGPLELSPVYRNKSVGFDGEDFLNMVVACTMDRELTDICVDIEEIHVLAGRRRGAEKFSARTLDIDILLYGQLVSAAPPMRLPRPDVLRHGFVLKPLADLAPDGTHPETGLTFTEHWQALEAAMTGGGHELNRVDLDEHSKRRGSGPAN